MAAGKDFNASGIVARARRGPESAHGSASHGLIGRSPVLPDQGREEFAGAGAAGAEQASGQGKDTPMKARDGNATVDSTAWRNGANLLAAQAGQGFPDFSPGGGAAGAKSRRRKGKAAQATQAAGRGAAVETTARNGANLLVAQAGQGLPRPRRFPPGKPSQPICPEAGF